MPDEKKTTAKKTTSRAANKETENETVDTPETSADAPEQAEETVVVSKSDLQGFLDRLNTLEEDNKRLIAVADKSRLQHERERAVAADGAPLIRTVKLSRLDSKNGPLVIAWKVLTNEAYVDGSKRVVTDQTIELFFKDGKSEKMRILDFYRRQNKETKAEIIKRSVNEATGETEVEVELQDGERLTIGLAFVN